MALLPKGDSGILPDMSFGINMRTPGINPTPNQDIDIYANTGGGIFDTVFGGGAGTPGADYTLPAITFLQGLTNAGTLYSSAQQTSYNARTMANDIDARIQQETQARQANARRESNAGTRRLAQIESGYSRSGVEMSGDVANYVAKVAAVQEAEIQQRNQDLRYKVEVMEIQKDNMLMAAKMRERSLLISSFTSLIGGGVEAMTQGRKITNYWEKFGPVPYTPPSNKSLIEGG